MDGLGFISYREAFREILRKQDGRVEGSSSAGAFCRYLSQRPAEVSIGGMSEVACSSLCAIFINVEMQIQSGGES